MCGITGILNFNGAPIDGDALKKMTTTLAHRGPDGDGYFIASALGLGHRRLAIIDLSDSGRQPMTTADGRYTIAYNGEVYNFKELRCELEGAGHRFRSRSDTEVLLAAYAQWGADCVTRFNGMFALAIWDGIERSLFLARDRYGIKPLYYALDGRQLLFASEHKAILNYPGFARRLDVEALLEYFTFQNLFTDKTFFEQIKLFPAGSWCSVTMHAPPAELTFHRYWDFNFHEPADPMPPQAYAEQLLFLFRQAVKRQMVSDVELGAYLSGGMDSGSITAVAATRMPYIKSFTCGFDLHSASGLELGFDERDKAEYMSYRFKTEHYEMVLKAGDMERILPRLAYHVEEPRVGQSYPNYYVAQLASKFVKVVLAGTGSDEIFGGYPWRYYRAVNNGSFEDYIDKYYLYWQRLIPNREIKTLFQPVWPQVKHVWTRDIFRDVFNGCRDRSACHAPSSPAAYINQSLYFEAKTFLHGLLIIEDKLSMAHGLETRVPFLDNDLVDFAMQVPVNLKLANLAQVARINENEPGLKTNKYFLKTRDGKLILRKAMRPIIPAAITDNVKQGFSAPDAGWFKGDSIDYVRKILLDPKAGIYTLLDAPSVHAIVNGHLEGKSNRRLFIWSLLSLEWFLRQYRLAPSRT